MYTKITYKGIKDGIYGIYCGFCPEGLDVQEEILVYYPDEGKVFIKDGEEYGAVILQDGETIVSYKEVEIDTEE